MPGWLERLFHRAAPAAGPLTTEGLLASDLWIDQPGAASGIERARRRGEITEEEAVRLRHFIEAGFLTFSIDLDEAVSQDLEATVETLWRERPADVAYAYHSQLKPLSRADEMAERKPSYRIADLHSSCEGARGLYLHPVIHRHVELVLGEPGVATQSLYFEFGSQQNLHRDPVFVQMQPPSHLVAAWIALEDIDPRSGPLVYVPGSQRLPYYQLAAGEHRFDHRQHGAEELAAMAEFDRQQMAVHGLSVEAFTPRRGEVLLWHHSLLHGGSPSEDPALTRKSFVIHFSSRSHFKRLKQTYLEEVPGPGGELVERARIIESERMLEAEGCWGFDSPLRGYRRPGRAAERVAER